MDRSAIATEADLIFLVTGSIATTIKGLQKAVALQADVVSESYGGADASCDGFFSGWEAAVFAAHQAGTLVIGSAGNSGDGRTGSCQITGLAEAPSQFVVGGLNDPGTGIYPWVDICCGGEGDSPQGGVTISTNGSTLANAFTAIDVVTTEHWEFAAHSGSTFVAAGGTSLAAPQIAGSALVFKNWMIGLGWAAPAATPGWVFANLLAMTDRANSVNTSRNQGFSPRWGGGRFQSRYYDAADNPGPALLWETAQYTISSGQHVTHLVGGAGNEPAGIQVFKAYAVFFEQDGANVADVDLRVFDKGCGSGSVLLRSDSSFDYKSMVKLGSEASGKDLCVELFGYHVPAGETRDVVLVLYYTSETFMR